MNYSSTCLYCGQPQNGLNYSCNCNAYEWTSEYRVIDLEIDINPQNISESYQTYSLNSPEGILQYGGLPFQHIHTEVTEIPGLTPLHELTNLSVYYGCSIFLKNEGDNPSGCFKDRETLLCLLNSEYNGLKKAVIYSSGNAAASAAHFVERTSRKLLTFVAGDTYPEKIDYIRKRGADVIVIGDNQTNFETGYRLFSDMNQQRIFTDYNYDNWSVRNPYRVQGDKTISLEIVKQLSEDSCQKAVPDYVIVPTANGSCLTGIWKGFKELKQAEVIARLPRMIPVGMKDANPVCKAVRLKQTDKPVRCNLSQIDPEDTEVGSTIVAEEGYDSIEAARAVIESGGFEVELHTADIKNALIDFMEHEATLALNDSILPEPASLTSLAAIKKMKDDILSPSDIIVPISTGDGAKSKNLIVSLLSDRPVLREKANRIVEEKQNINSLPNTHMGKKINVEANLESLTQSFKKLQRNISGVQSF